MKFKVGDRVRVLDGSGIEGYTGGWSPGMKEYVGKVATVRKVEVDEFIGREGYRLGDCGGYLYDERGLKQVRRRIIIEEKNGKVIARLGNKKVTIEAESLEDGAKAALDKVFKEQCKFKVGDVVEGISEDRYCITKKGWIGRVTEVCGDGIIEVYGSNGGGRYAHFDVEAEFFKLKVPRD